MYFLFVLIFSVLSERPVSELTIRVTELSFVDGNVPEDASFDEDALIEVAAHPDADTIVLKMVTCPLSHHNNTDGDRLALDGYQHAVALALNNAGAIIFGSIAALPCPPHCAGGYRHPTTLAEFLRTH